MARYESPIEGAKSKYWPRKVVCIDCVECELGELMPDNSHIPTMLEWHMSFIQLNKDGYQYEAYYNGDTYENLWHRLEAIAGGSNSLLIVTQKTSQTWAMIGLWEGLDNGSLVIKPDDCGTGTVREWAIRKLQAAAKNKGRAISCGKIAKLESSNSGYLVMSDPPMIAKVRRPYSRTWYTMVDYGNYGMSVPTTLPQGADSAWHMACSFRDIHKSVSESLGTGWKPTVGGIAYQAAKRHLSARGAVVCCHKSVESLESKLCISGRCEAYMIGKITGKVRYVDVRSAYCMALKSCPIPIRALDCDFGGRGVFEHVLASPYKFAADVTVDTPLPMYPLRRGGITIWPTGVFRTQLCGQELLNCVNWEHIVTVHDAVEYEIASPLEEFAVVCDSMRRYADANSNKSLSGFAKLLPNTLVGRFASVERRWIHADDPDCDIHWGEYNTTSEDGTTERHRSLGGVIQKQLRAQLSDESMPAISAWITAWARMVLWRLVLTAGQRNVYYTDTDALMINDIGFDRLIAGGCIRENELGMLGVRWESDNVEIRGIKHYVVDGVVTCSGVPGGLRDTDCGEEEYFHQQSPIEEIRKNRKPTGMRSTRQYIRQSKYRHGDVSESGVVTPFDLGD